ncbi:MAG: flagellar motor switch protein FliG [Sphingomonadales bacterium]|nr:flagellar motor switch protein FliG [Sphingomonadales bacterium]
MDALNAGADSPVIADAEAAAIMVMLLGDEQAAAILSALDPGELQLLGERMVALGEIAPEAIIESVNGFVRRTEKLGMPAADRTPQVRSLMARAVGQVKAENMMQRIVPDAGPASSIELTRWLNASSIVPMVKGEHPQALAVLLVQLDPDVAAQVLHSLPQNEQAQIVHRVATMGPVSVEALAMLEELLTRRIGEVHGAAMLQMGGPRPAAEIINNAGKATEKRIMPEISKADKLLARKIEEEMFKFEHLFVLDPQSMGALLREVESESLINALKGIEPEQRDVFFRAMSSRAADGVKDEIASLGRLKMAEVMEAQRSIIAAAKRLAAEGVISFGSGGGDDEYV